MSDPFSVAGSAVGVISLGLSACQGLLAYYGPFKSFHEEISDVTSQIESLDGILKVLQNILFKIDIQHASPTADSTKIALDAIMRCQQKLQKLETTLDKCAKTPAKMLLVSKLRLNRILYPFRQETLMSLIKTMGWLQGNLNTALQMLNISMMIANQRQMTLVASYSASASSSSGQISNLAQDLGHKQTAFDNKLTAFEQHLTRLESSIISHQGRPILEPALLKSLLDEQQNFDKDQDALVIKQPLQLQRSRLRCTCPRPGAASSAQPAPHRPGCPYSLPSKTVLSLGKRWTICNWLLKVSVNASLEITRGAGGFAISPILQFRTIVSERSPAFSLLLDARGKHWPQECHINTQDISRQLFKLFQDGKASPLDTLPDGDTLLHVVTGWRNYSSLEMSTWLNCHDLITSLLTMGVPPNSANNYGETPADDIIYSFHDCSDVRMQQVALDLCSDLLNAGGYITPQVLKIGYHHGVADLSQFVMWRSSKNYTFQLLQRVADRASIEDINVPEELIPLILQSKDELNSLLKRGVDMQGVIDSYAAWPEGLSCLLQAGYSPGPKTLRKACEADCKESLKLLIKSRKFHLNQDDFRVLGNHNDPEVATLIIQALADRRKRLQSLAETYLSEDELFELNIQSDSLLGFHAAKAYQLLKSKCVAIDDVEETEGWLIYNFGRINFNLADELWDAGFRDVDEVDDNGTGPFGHLRLFGIVEGLETVLAKANWLIAKGADLYRRTSNTPALHYLGSELGFSCLGIEDMTLTLSQLNKESRELMRKVFLDSTQDLCHCHCSVNGCRALTRTLDGFNVSSWDLAEAHTRQLARMIHFLASAPELELLDDQKSKSFCDGIAPPLLRYITFHYLGITHTCTCKCGYGRNHNRGLDEVREIHDEERYLIQQLDDLVEEFLTRYYHEPSDMSLPAFLTGYWWTRMNEVLSDRTPPTQEEIRQVREIGVVLDTD